MVKATSSDKDDVARERLARCAAVAALVQKWRQASGLSVQELSSAIGKHRAYVHRVEKGETMPPLECLAAIAWALEQPLSDLLSAAGIQLALRHPPLSQYLRERYAELPVGVRKQVVAQFETAAKPYLGPEVLKAAKA